MILQPSTKLWLQQEALSIFQTLLAFMAVDAAGALTQLYSGPWDKALWMQLGFALLRSLVKTILVEVFPAFFGNKLPPVA